MDEGLGVPYRAHLNGSISYQGRFSGAPKHWSLSFPVLLGDALLPEGV